MRAAVKGVDEIIQNFYLYIMCAAAMAYLDRDRSVSVLYTIRGPNLQSIGFSRFSVQSFTQSQNTCIRRVQLKVALVPRHQTIRKMPQCVRISGPQGSHHLSNRKIL